MPLCDSKTIITLKGSVAIVSEFFFTAINSILYQRGIYNPETFKKELKYGLTVLTTTDEGLIKYLQQIMEQMRSWLVEGDVQRFVLVVTGIDSLETLERWQFNVSVERDNKITSELNAKENFRDENRSYNCSQNEAVQPSSKRSMKKKSIKDIHNEIQAIVKQITASVTFLPLLNEPCSFDLLVYTNKSAVVPKKWEDSDPRYIMNSQEVKLRSFTTTVHKVDSMVSYKEADEWEL